MSCSDDEEVGQPVVELDAKRAWDEVPVTFDWHNFLINTRENGHNYALNYRFRLKRKQSTGFQYKVTTAGCAGNTEPRWPKTVGATVTDGTIVWTAEAIDANSLRTTIASEDYVVATGLTNGGETVSDLKYTILIAGGTSGQEYDIKHRVICANGEDKEAVGKLPVID